MVKNLIVLLIIAIAGYWAYGQYQRQQEAKRVAEAAGLAAQRKKPPAGAKKNADEPAVSFFTCDGRNTCVQMTSCEEAKFYVKNCPGMSSEGTRGGISCEKQWCAR